MIRFHSPCESMPNFMVPVLHKVPYNPAHNEQHIRAWIQNNCRAASYGSPSWHRRPFYEFEDDEDATMFALRWA